MGSDLIDRIKNKNQLDCTRLGSPLHLRLPHPDSVCFLGLAHQRRVLPTLAPVSSRNRSLPLYLSTCLYLSTRSTPTPVSSRNGSPCAHAFSLPIYLFTLLPLYLSKRLSLRPRLLSAYLPLYPLLKVARLRLLMLPVLR